MHHDLPSNAIHGPLAFAYIPHGLEMQSPPLFRPERNNPGRGDERERDKGSGSAQGTTPILLYWLQLRSKPAPALTA
jgi:hypothetical protein